MKKIIALLLVLVSLSALAGCNGTKPEKCAQMAVEYIKKETKIDFNSFSSSKYYVKTNNSAKDYSYYSPSDEEKVTEYEDVSARVYIVADDMQVVVFIKDGAEENYDKSGISDEYFDNYIAISESDIEEIVSKKSVDYPKTTAAFMWREEKERIKAYIPSEDELGSWTKFVPGDLKSKK